MAGNRREPIRVLIADDEALLRGGVRMILDAQPDIEVVGEAADGADAVEQARRLRPDVVLMDVRMPDMDGLEATRAIKRDRPLVGVLMVTMHEDPDYLLEALKAGAAGYVLKEADQDELVSAVLRALSGDSPMDSSLTSKLLKQLVNEIDGAQGWAAAPAEPGGQPSGGLLEPLTPRELEVLGLLAQGYTNRQIAKALVISAGTAKNHVEHIIGKMGVSDRTQAAVRAYQLGLIALPDS